MQHKLWFSSLLKNTTGPFYDDGLLQILFKLEIRGSQGRLTLSYRNKSSGDLNNVQIKLLSDNGMIRFKSNNDVPNIIAPMQPEQQLFFLECMKPATASPILSLSYYDSNSIKHEIIIPTPILSIQFNESLSLSPNDFMNKWSTLQGQGRDTSLKMSIGENVTRGVILKDIKDVISQTLRFGLVSELCQNSTLVAAASLRTGTISASGEKVSIGCLLRMTLDSSSNSIVNIEIRTLHSSATEALKEVIQDVISNLK